MCDIKKERKKERGIICKEGVMKGNCRSKKTQKERKKEKKERKKERKMNHQEKWY